MEIIILLLLLVIVVLIFKQHKSKKDRHIIQVQFNSHTPTTSERKARDQRIKRHNRIRTVLRFMVTYNELLKSSDFHSLAKNQGLYEEAFGHMRKEEITSHDIETAIRFCHKENFYGLCKHELDTEETELLRHWRDITIDERALASTVLESYQAYWEDVLNSYKRPSARKNRLQYLIDDIDDILRLPIIQGHPDIIAKVQALQNHYIELRNIG